MGSRTGLIRRPWLQGPDPTDEDQSPRRINSDAAHSQNQAVESARVITSDDIGDIAAAAQNEAQLSTLTFPSFTTFAHLAISVWMN